MTPAQRNQISAQSLYRMLVASLPPLQFLTSRSNLMVVANCCREAVESAASGDEDTHVAAFASYELGAALTKAKEVGAKDEAAVR